MKITKVPKAEIKGLLADVQTEINARYNGNIRVDQYQSADPRRFTLRVLDSRGTGARRAASGRRIPCACWHVHRDFLAGIFRRYPNAAVRTALAVYKGADSFERQYRDTASHNVGSEYRPSHIGANCDCSS